MTARIVAVTNQKGGSGKTTTSMTLAAGLVRRGFKTLVVDGDPQGSATRWYAMSPESTPFPAPVVSLAEARGKIGQALRDHVEAYDVLVIDCPPNLDSPVMLSVLFVADVAIAPVIPSAIDAWATEKLLRVVEMAQAHNPGLRVLTLLNMVRNTALARDMMADLGDDESLQLLETAFTLRTAYQEAAALGVSVFDRGDRRAVQEANQLTEEVLSHLGLISTLPSPAPGTKRKPRATARKTSKSDTPEEAAAVAVTEDRVDAPAPGLTRRPSIDDIGPARALRTAAGARGSTRAG